MTIRCIVTITMVAIIQVASKSQLDNMNIHCGFFDSVNITGAELLANGFYRFNDVLYPRNMVEEYDYSFTNFTNRIPATSHLRGCICELKPCIRFCCPKNSYLKNSKCIEFSDGVETTLLNVTDRKTGVTKWIDLYETNGYFGANYGSFCIGFVLDSISDPSDGWQLLTSGSLLTTYENQVFPKDMFCMTPHKSSQETGYSLKPYVCFGEPPADTNSVLYSAVMLFSVPFLIATALVYAIIPELRNLHGKCLICYLTALAIGYLNISILKLKSVLDSGSCFLLGYSGYFFLIASFFWLSIMSFDLWWSFRQTKGTRGKSSERKRFLTYSIIGWGLPFIMLMIILFVDHAIDFNNIYKPGIDGITACWIRTDRWIALLYLFGPILLIIIINTIMFAMTAFKIRKIQIETSRVMAKQDSSRNLQKQTESYGLFLRLFVIMGVSWAMESISWIITKITGLDHWSLQAADIFNCFQGLLIFVLFVMKKKIWKLIVKRYRILRGLPPILNQTTSTSTTVNVQVGTAM